MHNAPPIAFPLGRSRFQAWLLGGYAAVALAAFALWLRQASWTDWRLLCFALLTLTLWSWAVGNWWRSPGGRLCWDGQSWCWHSAGVSACGALRVRMDLQFFLLLSLNTNTTKSAWLWAERAADAQRWRDFRCAVFARHATAARQPDATQTVTNANIDDLLRP